MINKDRIRQKLANINNKGSTAYWSPPKEGKATIRMFPCPHSEDPILDYFFHFNIARSSILCPLKNGLGSSCPICKLADRMYRSGSEQDKLISKKLYAKQRFYATIIDRADDTLTAKYWGFSLQLYTQFLNWLSDDSGDYADFMDDEKGLDLVVSLEQNPAKQFAAARAEPKRRETPLAASKADLEAILKSVKPASEVFVALSPEEIQMKLDEFLAQEGTQELENTSEGVVKGATEKPQSRPKQNVNDLFDAMANEL